MTKYIFYYTLIVSTLFSCDSTQERYTDLDELYADFPTYIKDPNTENLRKYCYDITPNNDIVRYMKANNFSYRGLPEALEVRLLEPSYIGEQYYDLALTFIAELNQKKQLEDLKYIGREMHRERLFDKTLDIYATDTFILLESEGDTLRCKLGEMLKINGRWISFTSPELGW